MNAIITYTQTSEFTEETQKEINKVQFSQIPEMLVKENLGIVDEVEQVISRTIPFQANVDDDKFEYFKSLLEQYGVVDIIGKWNDDGSKIELDINKYRDALNDVKTFEQAVFLDGVDVTGQELPQPQLDEDGNEIPLNIRTFKRVKESKRPTLAQAKQTQVNVFNNQFTRQLV